VSTLGDELIIKLVEDTKVAIDRGKFKIDNVQCGSAEQDFLKWFLGSPESNIGFSFDVMQKQKKWWQMNKLMIRVVYNSTYDKFCIFFYKNSTPKDLKDTIKHVLNGNDINCFIKEFTTDTLDFDLLH